MPPASVSVPVVVVVAASVPVVPVVPVVAVVPVAAAVVVAPVVVVIVAAVVYRGRFRTCAVPRFTAAAAILGPCFRVSSSSRFRCFSGSRRQMS